MEVNEISVDLLIRFSDPESLQATSKLGGQYDLFVINNKRVRTGLQPKTDNHRDEQKSEEDEDFTTESSSDEN